jgi:AraC-like DNA-binding protein
MGIPFSRCLKRLRVEKAKLLHSDPHPSIAHIADALGFSDQFAFSHFFKKSVGCLPSNSDPDSA